MTLGWTSMYLTTVAVDSLDAEGDAIATIKQVVTDGSLLYVL